MITAVLFLVVNMLIATQYAITKVGYEYVIVHPSDANIRYIGSDNTTGGRVLRMVGSNTTGTLKIALGNWSTGTNKIYSAAFGIVNEEDVPVSITHINVSSADYSYMQIWLHGNREANANSNLTDPTSVFMFNNGTVINTSDTIAWTLAAGDNNPNTMCSNVSNRTIYRINTTWDNTSHVRYSLNNTIAYGIGMMGRTANNASDYVWVQIGIDIPASVNSSGMYMGDIWIHYTASTQL